ncbi:MAG: ERF family protein [Cellulosilyticum sp.]|nr:ERF family protein [Cellulosilyticum sp.]
MNIYESINAIMQDMGAIGKNKTNIQQNFKFRGIDDVMNHLKPLLAKYKVFVVPQVLSYEREERKTSKGNNLLYSVCNIKYTFYAEDGSNVEAVVTGEGMDSGDKATNKAMAIAFKYALFQVFCIPTEEMKDPDADTPTESSKKTEIVLTDEQVKELYKVAGDKQVSSLVVDKQVQKKFGCKVQELTLAQYKFMLDGYEKLEVKEGK